MRVLLDEYHAFISRYYQASWNAYAKGFELFPEVYTVSAGLGGIGDGGNLVERGAVTLDKAAEGSKEKGKGRADEGKGKEGSGVGEELGGTSRRPTTRGATSRRITSKETISDSDREDATLMKTPPASRGTPYVELTKRPAKGSVVKDPLKRLAAGSQPSPSSPLARVAALVVRSEESRAPTEEPGEEEEEVDQLRDDTPVAAKMVVGGSGENAPARRAAAALEVHLSMVGKATDVVSFLFKSFGDLYSECFGL